MDSRFCIRFCLQALVITFASNNLFHFMFNRAIMQIIAELVGTYIFIFVGCGSALVDRERTLTIVGIALAWGLSLMALIYTLSHVSGAHFNPAVTIAFAAARKLPLMQVRTFNQTPIMIIVPT